MAPPPSLPDDGDPVRRLLVVELTRAAVAAGLPAPERDVRLDRAADDLARTTPEESQPSFDVVSYLVAHYGIVEPEPNLLFGRGGPHAEDAIVDLLRGQIPRLLARQPRSRLGIGVFRGKELSVVMALQEHHLELRPVRRALTPGLVAELDGRLLDGYRLPKVIVTGPGGDVRELRVRQARGRFSASFGCRRDETGAYQLEIAAESEQGPLVLANFPVYCGVEPPPRSPPVVLETVGRQDPAAAEEELVTLINQERLARGLSPLRAERRLAEVARAHSQEMASTGVVAHVSPRTGNAADRVAKIGLRPMVVAENVGSAYTAAQAHRGFMTSPGHRANVIEPRVTTLGVGVVAGREENGMVTLYFTELFTDSF
jgi:uncharacterized protein YkwD